MGGGSKLLEDNEMQYSSCPLWPRSSNLLTCAEGNGPVCTGHLSSIIYQVIPSLTLDIPNQLGLQMTKFWCPLFPLFPCLLVRNFSGIGRAFFTSRKGLFAFPLCCSLPHALSHSFHFSPKLWCKAKCHEPAEKPILFYGLSFSQGSRCHLNEMGKSREILWCLHGSPLRHETLDSSTRRGSLQGALTCAGNIKYSRLH